MIRSGVLWSMGVTLLVVSLGLGSALPPSAPRSSSSPAPPAVSPPVADADPVARSAPVVYLTFDDGPHPVYTPQILEVLASHGVRGTFFVVGSMVRNWPDTARRIVEAGHSIQLHSWRHGNLTKFTRQEFIADTARAQAALAEVVSKRATCLRPPYGMMNAQLEEWATELDLKMVMWSTSGADWLEISASQIARRVVNGVRPGSVVLLHDGGGPRHRTVTALGIILEELTEAGYRFRPICSSLPITEQIRVCWDFYAWPAPRPCPDDSPTDT